MLVGNKNRLNSEIRDRFQIIVENEQLERVRSTRYLGVILDDSVNWIEQTQSVSASIAYKVLVSILY